MALVVRERKTGTSPSLHVLQAWLETILRLENEARNLEGQLLSCGEEKQPRTVQFVLPDDCKVLQLEDRLIITAPAPKKTPEEDRDEVGRRIWLVMVHGEHESGKPWKETGTGKTALEFADAVVRFRREG
ncbi:MAG: hypothetical protein KAJ19_09935 [Gammaproteobacteria bacterium]|nr:hypothetical protein [Gammaproteobacteria bacterium]